MQQHIESLAMIGFGEAASAIVNGWGRERSWQVSAFDCKTDIPSQRDEVCRTYDNLGVIGCDTVALAIRNTDVVFSLVTADQAHIVAIEAARSIAVGQIYIDCNSCSPETKKRNAKVIEAAGGLYIDLAIMAPIHPAQHQTPMLLSGTAADIGVTWLSQLGMNVRLIDGGVGKASAIKMIRSIMVKGLEALTAECVLSAYKLGVDDEVLASLENSYPEFGWVAKSGYALERMATHGVRRAAEMEEVVATVRDIGLKAEMSGATFTWQKLLGEMDTSFSSSGEYKEIAKQILRDWDPMKLN